MKTLYHLKGIHFSPEPGSKELALLKIKNGLGLEGQEAEDALKIIASRGTLIVELENTLDPQVFGINFFAQTDEVVKAVEKKEAERQAYFARREALLPVAREWYENLSEDQKELVGILAATDLRVYAVA